MNRELTQARLQLLITTRLSDPQHNTQVWQDDAGQLQAAVFLLQRALGYPLELTYLLDPRADQPAEREILHWAQACTIVVGKEQGAALPLFVLCSERLHTSITLFEQMGFTRLADYSPCLARSLEGDLPASVPSPGFTLRSLAGKDDLEQYSDLYNQVLSFVSVEQRQRLMSSIGYNPDINLVVQAEDGAFVAFCECSACPEEWPYTRQPEGWLEHLGTHPDYQRRGLGRLVTIAAMQRLKQAGAQRALLMTSNSNIEALKLYESLGFEVVERNWIYVWEAAT